MGADVSGAKSPKSEPNVVPLCDILLVLLIIFMVVTPMIQKGANVTLPDAHNLIDQPEPGQLFTIFIKKDGAVIFEGSVNPVESMEQLTKLILDKMEQEQKFDKKVLLKADADVNYGKLVDVLAAIRAAQIEFVGLITEKKTSSL